MSDVASISARRGRRADALRRGASRRPAGRTEPAAGSKRGAGGPGREPTRVVGKVSRLAAAAKESGAGAGPAPRRPSETGAQMISSSRARPAWAGLFPALTIAVAALSVLALALPRPGGIGEPRYTLRLDPPPAVEPAVAIVPPMPAQPAAAETAEIPVPEPTLLRSVPRAPAVLEAATAAIPAAPRPQPAEAGPAVSVSMPSQSGESTASITAITMPGAVATPADDRMIGLGAGAVGRSTAGLQAPEVAVGGEPLPSLVTPIVPVGRGQTAAEMSQGSPDAASQGAAPPSVLPGLPEEAPKPARAAKVKAKAKPAAAVASEPAAKPQKAKAAKTARKPVAAAKKPSVFKSEDGRR